MCVCSLRRTQALKIHDVVVARKKRRDTLRRFQIEKCAHHGALYTFGSNARGQLGHPLLDLAKPLTAPLLAAFFKNSELRVVATAVSAVHASAVTSDGRVYTWGTGVPGAFGFLWKNHTGASEATANVSTTGASVSSRLSGHVRKLPTRVEDLDDVNIVAVALGDRHSVALSERGVLFTWGAGSFGQLGHGDVTGDASAIFTTQFDPHAGREYPCVGLPLQLDKSYFEEMRVLEIACGYYFTVALCEDGSVFTWGEGSDGQLGLGYADHFRVGFLDDHIHGSNFVYMHSPTRVDELTEPIGGVAVGGNHVYAVSRDHRSVLEWGAWARRGGDAQESAFAPQRNAELSALFVERIATGKEHALATAGRVEFTLTIERTRRGDDDVVVKAFGLCARFGAQPVSLARPVLGGVCRLAPSVSPALSRPLASVGTSTAAAALSAVVYDRTDAHVRSSLSRCTGKVVLLDRGTSTGHWISLLERASSSLLEIPCVPAMFGPALTETGVSAKLFHSPEKLRCLRLYVRPDEVVGRIVVLEFDQDDIRFEADDLELSEMITMIMVALVEKVKDAQEAGAAAVVVVFDFLEADPFALEASDDDTFEFLIPTVMVRKSHHGELLLEHISGNTKPWGILSFKEDILGKQVRRCSSC